MLIVVAPKLVQLSLPSAQPILMITPLGLEVTPLHPWVQDHCGNVDHIIIEPLVVVVELLPSGIDVRAEVLLRGDTGGLLGRSAFCSVRALAVVRTFVL